MKQQIFLQIIAVVIYLRPLYVRGTKLPQWITYHA